MKEERGTAPGKGKMISQHEKSFLQFLKKPKLTISMAYRWQQLAKIPEKKFEGFLAEFKVEVGLLSG